jgi:ribonucleoside-diphosphate reductase alpha chain
MLFENLRLRPSVASSQLPEIGDMNGSEPKLESSFGSAQDKIRPKPGSLHAADALAGIIDLGDAPTCSFCGSIMTRNGSCYRCGSCGSTSGCS